MARLRVRRDRQRGNSLLLAMIVMSALATLGSLTVVSVQGSLKASTADRTQALAMYAAESGAAAAMDFLRRQPTGQWRNFQPPSSPVFPSNNAQPGDPHNLFSPDQNAWFSVQIFNDPAEGRMTPDGDNRVVIESTGHGPQGAVAIIDWEVKMQTFFDIPTNLPDHFNAFTHQPELMLLGFHVVL